MTDTDNTPATESVPADDGRPAEYVADIGFDNLPMAEELRRAIADRGWAHPTPVQARAFQPAIEGRDLIVRSKTGTGKTAAFGLPILQQLDNGERAVKAIVLCPTRELALQVANELRELAKYKDIRIAAIYGGASMRDQEDALESGSAIVVGTPGRVIDHIRRGNLKLKTVRHAVLDEADEMLDQGFYEDVTRILDQLPKDRQVLLFSATVPEDIERLIARYTTNAETILMSGDVYTVEHIHHIRYEISDEYPKPRNLLYVLEREEPDNAIIFCNTRDDTELVTAVLNRNGFDAELLNGDLPQKERERVMAKVKRGEVAFMVATDLAARGIDISDLRYVINYSLPEDPAVYLHRVGRTGRIGKKGTAINLTSGKELATLTALEKKYGIQFERRQMPTPEEAMKIWSERHVREIREASAASVYEGYLGLAKELRQRPDAEDLIAFLLKYFFSHKRMEKVQERAKSAKGEAPKEAREGRRERGERRDRGEKGDRGERGERRKERREDRERGGEREERPRRERKSRELEAAEGQVKFWVGLGKANQLDEAGLKDALGRLGAPKEKILGVDLRPTFSYILVPEADAAAFEAVNGQTLNDRTVKVERARPRGEKVDRDQELREKGFRDPPGQVRLMVSLGTDDGFDEASVKASLESLGAPADKVLRVSMRNAHAYVLVNEEDAPAFEALHGKVSDDRTLRVERMKQRPDNERTPREPRAKEPALEPGQVKLWVGLGKADNVDEAGITTALEGAGAPAGKVARVSVRPNYSYVVVPEEDVPAFEALNGKLVGDKALKLERARPPRR